LEVLHNSSTLVDSYSLHIHILTFCLAEFNTFLFILVRILNILCDDFIMLEFHPVKSW